MENEPCTLSKRIKLTSDVVPSPSEDKMAKFFYLSKSAILSIVTGYADMFKADHKILSKLLCCLYQEYCLLMSYTDLLK